MAITDVDVAAAALMKKVLLVVLVVAVLVLVLVGKSWSDSEFLSNRNSSRDAISSSLFSICSIISRTSNMIGNSVALGVPPARPRRSGRVGAQPPRTRASCSS